MNSSPSSPRPTLPPPPPPIPWRWQCHNCHASYLLSCTRRCLSCSHVFCQRDIHNKAIVTTGAATTSSSSSSPRLRRQSQNRQRRRQRRGGGPCDNKFDYDGWAAWGSWRRTTLLRRTPVWRKLDEVWRVRPLPSGYRTKRRQVDAAALATWKLRHVHVPHNKDGKKKSSERVWLPREPASQARVLANKEAMYLRGEHDCSLHCDYPNECGYALYAARQRLEAAELEEEEEVVVEEEEEEVAWEEVAGSPPSSSSSDSRFDTEAASSDDDERRTWPDIRHRQPSDETFEIYCDRSVSPLGGGEDGDTELRSVRLGAWREATEWFANAALRGPENEGVTGNAEADEYLQWIMNYDWDGTA